ncbi:MAG TPA: hypothetical protein VMG10_19805 [Gemmataceae bacterium]|nr:hypothetical protein [Gemmataceae bacterium]
MSSSILRLTPLLVVAAMAFASSPAPAQFTVAGGIAAPALLPPPIFPYGRYGGLGYGLGVGAGLGYGFGWNNWMQNPYEGYLNGAANVTTANAQYQLTIQQAKLAREEARRSALQTRRAALEERQYELSLMPDAEQLRQQQLMKSLQRSRNNPPLTEIWSATALNDLLRAIQLAHTRGVTGPAVPLSTETLKHINMTAGTTRGGVGLLRNDGKLTWPYVLRRSTFDEQRKRMDESLAKAVKAAHAGPVAAELLHDLTATQKQLERALDGWVADLTPSEFIQGSRYLRELKDSIRLLQESDVSRYFRTEWTPQGSTVAELVRQMTRQGLRFAPAVSGDESYYTSLHRSLVDYDMGLSQLTAMQPRP